MEDETMRTRKEIESTIKYVSDVNTQAFCELETLKVVSEILLDIRDTQETIKKLLEELR